MQHITKLLKVLKGLYLKTLNVGQPICMINLGKLYYQQ